VPSFDNQRLDLRTIFLVRKPASPR
jgi:hypothetical protein